ncbi:MAG: carbohydrate ABC transporter permease, partial [Aristaeellaceae bacterium]
MIRAFSFRHKHLDLPYVLIMLVLMLVCVVTLYPFLNILAISFNESTDTVRGGIHLWPRAFTLDNYREVLRNPRLATGMYVSVARTVIGTLFSLFSTAMVAYVISRKDFVLSKAMYWMFLITMYVGGGMIPDFLLVRAMGLMNNFWVYIIPGLIGGWNVFVMKSFMDGLPASLQESARLDGAHDLMIFYKIVLP